jgi:hypothetical protein
VTQGGRWVLTGWVSCSAGLLVPPYRLLSLIDTLTSRFDGEEGVGTGVVGSGLFCVGQRYQYMRTYKTRETNQLVYKNKKQTKKLT